MKPEALEPLKYIMVGAAPVGKALADLFKKKAPHVDFREGKDIWPSWALQLIFFKFWKVIYCYPVNAYRITATKGGKQRSGPNYT